MDDNQFHSDENLLDYLYKLSGTKSRQLDGDDYKLVCSSLWHPSIEIRERAIFIGGLRCLDKTINFAIRAILLEGIEPSDENRRLMVESIVSFCLMRPEENHDIESILEKILISYSKSTLTAKAAYVGILRLSGAIDQKQFASLDYERVIVP